MSYGVLFSDLMGYDTVYYCRYLATFRRNLLHASSTTKQTTTLLQLPRPQCKALAAVSSMTALKCLKSLLVSNSSDNWSVETAWSHRAPGLIQEVFGPKLGQDLARMIDTSYAPNRVLPQSMEISIYYKRGHNYHYNSPWRRSVVKREGFHRFLDSRLADGGEVVSLPIIHSTNRCTIIVVYHPRLVL
jgi:hypothetical protein